MTAKSPIVTTSALARHLGLTDRRVQQLVEEGVLPRRRDGKLDQDACRLKYIKYLQTEGRRAKGSDARDRAQLARAEMLELQAARERGELGYFSDMEEVFTDVLGAFRAELSGVPTASTRDLALRATIEAKQNEAIDRCRGRFEAEITALKTGSDPFSDDEADDA